MRQQGLKPQPFDNTVAQHYNEQKIAGIIFKS